MRRTYGTGLILALACLLTSTVARAQIGSVLTAKTIPQATVDLIDPESGTSTGGTSGTDVKIAVGDVILFRFVYLPTIYHTSNGMQGYLTEYIPRNTQVVGIRLIDANGKTITPRWPGVISNDCGSACPSTSLHCGTDATPGTCSVPAGSVAQVYGDTGIFYSTSALTARNPAGAFIAFTNGVPVGGITPAEVTGQNGVGDLVGAGTTGPYYSHNNWDYYQVLPFGTGGNVWPYNVSNGQGSTPYLYGSPVAGPKTHYPYQATFVQNDIRFNSDVGPWGRIVYPGSLVGTGDQNGYSSALTRMVQTLDVNNAASWNWDVTPANPLPTSTNAVRLATGELRAGEPLWAEIALKVLAVPLDGTTAQGGTNKDIDCAEAFGSASSGGPSSVKGDNSWPSYLGAPACVYLNLLFDLTGYRPLAVVGQDNVYTIHGKNLSIYTQTGVIVRLQYNPNDATGPTGSGFTGPFACGTACAYVEWHPGATPGTLLPSEEYSYTVTFNTKSAGHLTHVKTAIYISDNIPAPGFQVRGVTVTNTAPIFNLTMTEPTPYVTPTTSGTVSTTLSGQLCNPGGTLAATYDTLQFMLPNTWRVVSGPCPGTTNNYACFGTASNATCTGTASSTPTCAINPTVDPDTCVPFSIHVNVPTGTATGLYPIDVDAISAGPQDTYFDHVVTVPVNQPRAPLPTIDCPIPSSGDRVTGTATPGATVKVYFNGILRATTTAAADGTWAVYRSVPWPDGFQAFGTLYGGLEIRATAEDATHLTSLLSTVDCFVKPTKPCSDGVDNDGDGFTDFPADPGCSSPLDDSELPNNQTYPATDECNDGVDNDGDGLTDMDDPDCHCPSGIAGRRKVERPNAVVPACNDGCDNDGDGAIDFYGRDVDNDGVLDYPPDPGCHSANDESEDDVQDPSGVISARLLLVFDTSGSMNWNTCGDNTFMGGDGTSECTGTDLVCNSPTCSPSGCGDGIADDTRVWKVKNGVAAAVAAFGEVEWGLMRFHQRGERFAVTGGVGCPTTNASLGSGGWQGSYLPPCGGGFNAADLLVKFSSDNTYDLLQWMDARSNWLDAATNVYPIPPGFDFELRGTGTTPIAGSLDSALTYLESVKGADPKGDCRPYRVILVTDGAESCACAPEAAVCNPPVDAAAALLANHFPTYVIGFATPDASIQAKLQAIAGAGGTGDAIFADDAVSLSTAIANIVKDSVKVELCNGLDDNCNGLTDEGFPVGVACDNGLLGICKCSGSYACSADGTGVECVYPATPPANTCQPKGTEICCNGLDDNCDGRIDEPPCRCGSEVCNGIDDDGNGLTDDGPMPGVGDPCGSDVGECNPGVTQCIDGRIQCDYTGVTHPFPVDETCNCLDDNCNGVIDEGVVRECYACANGGTPGVGECRSGLQVCDPSGCPTVGWTNPSCGGQVCPTTEVCDGKDNDCNGTTDLDSNGNPLTERCYSGTTGCDWATGLCKGECAWGTRTCSNGTWSQCAGEVLPTVETCDGKDNDCDGTTDGTGGVVLSQSCYSGPNGTDGVGICHAGTQTCNPATGQFGACVGEVTPATSETCNGQDDDCNGLVDDGLTRSCYTGPAGTENVGICHGGTETCANGAWGTCANQQTPTTEICDGQDNNCDGQTDENTAQPCYDDPQSGCDITTRTCKGVCKLGVRQCVNGVLSTTCTGQVRPTAELCNGRDDDCDGTVDGTGGVAMTQPCYTGPAGTENTGICHGGTQTCTNATWGSCDNQQLPTTEVCDGKDNNCNGQTDENTAELCYDLPYDGCDPTTRICKGVCALGTRACVNGALSPTCADQIRPTSEQCNGLDDDCDGTTDMQYRDCYTGPSGTQNVGPCKGGQQQCVAGNWQACTGEVVPVAETCNDVDDNCNGLTDEGLQNVRCYEPPVATPWGCEVATGICVGTCAFGHQSCTNGAMSACTGATYPIDEVCNGLDDNCNGAVDEGLTESYYTGPGGTVNVGECKAGVRTCNIGNWDVTVPQVVPKPEECNGLDDDCDGMTDEDALGNPLKENCYDYTKGGCDQATGVCQGVCAHGVSTCVDGALGTCVGMIVPTQEVCDNLDNDCDGQVDEDLTRPYYTGRVPEECDLSTEVCKGECRVGHETCTAGVWYSDGNQILPSPEVCDNKDNDCNGLTDDGLVGVKCYDGGSECDLQSGVCKGICQIGTKACNAGVWSTCDGQVLPRSEVCNCFDDDCNGETDEGTLPGVGEQCDVGVCNGVKVCDQHLCAIVCSPTAGAGVEICDGRDNDCDNLIDEEPGPNDPPLCEKDPTVTPPGPDNRCAGDLTTCEPTDTNGFGYVCSPGHYACVNGAIDCVGAVLPQPEVCDGIDNDCDGITDDGDLCTEGSVCYKGECVDPCKNDEFPCTGGRTCVDGGDLDARLPCQNPGADICFCISALCGDKTCDPGWICREQDGNCHDLCENVQCDSPLQCYYGQCLDCTVLGCPPGQFCAGQTCVDDPCASIQCAPGEICTQGECVSTCAGVTCPTGQVCRAGECVGDPCSDILCVPGKVCDPTTAECVTDPCIAQSCAPGSLCSTQTGQCMPDPCLLTTCGDCTECVADRYFMTATCKYQEGCGEVKIYAAGGCSVATEGGGGLKVVPLLLLIAFVIVRRRRAAGGGR